MASFRQGEDGAANPQTQSVPASFRRGRASCFTAGLRRSKRRVAFQGAQPVQDRVELPLEVSDLLERPFESCLKIRRRLGTQPLELSVVCDKSCHASTVAPPAVSIALHSRGSWRNRRIVLQSGRDVVVDDPMQTVVGVLMPPEVIAIPLPVGLFLFFRHRRNRR